jgi:hypothetical protein
MTWAPFSIVGEEIQRMSGDRPHSRGRSRSSAGLYDPVAVAEDDMVEMNVGRRLSVSSGSVPAFMAADLEAANASSSNELSGV